MNESCLQNSNLFDVNKFDWCVRNRCHSYLFAVHQSANGEFEIISKGCIHKVVNDYVVLSKWAFKSVHNDEKDEFLLIQPHRHTIQDWLRDEHTKEFVTVPSESLFHCAINNPAVNKPLKQSYVFQWGNLLLLPLDR